MRCGALALSALVLLGFYMNDGDDDTLTSLLFRTFNVLLAIVVWFLGRRWKKKLINILPVLYIVELALIVQEARVVQPLREEGESILGEDLYMRMLFDYLLYVNVLAPSYHFAIFIYVPGVLAAVTLA